MYNQQNSYSEKRLPTWREDDFVSGNRASTWREGDFVASNRPSTWREDDFETDNRSSILREGDFGASDRPSTWKEGNFQAEKRPSTWREGDFRAGNRPTLREGDFGVGNRPSTWREGHFGTGNRPSTWRTEGFGTGNRPSTWRIEGFETGNSSSTWREHGSATCDRSYDDYENLERVFDSSTNQYNTGGSLEFEHAQQKQQGVYNDTESGVGHQVFMRRPNLQIRNPDTYTRDHSAPWHDKKHTTYPYYNEEAGFETESSAEEEVKVKKLKVERSSQFQLDNRQQTGSESKQIYPPTEDCKPDVTVQDNQQYLHLTNVAETTPVIKLDITNSLVKNLDLSSILPDNQLKNLKSIFDKLKSPETSQTIKHEHESRYLSKSGLSADQHTGQYHKRTGPYHQHTGPYHQQTGPYHQQTGPYHQTSRQHQPQTGQYQPHESGQHQLQTGQYQPHESGQHQLQTGQYQPHESGQHQLQTGQYQPQESGQHQLQTGQYQPQQSGQHRLQTGQYQPQQLGQNRLQTGQYQPQQLGQNRLQTGQYQHQQSGQHQLQTGQYQPQQSGQHQLIGQQQFQEQPTLPAKYTSPGQPHQTYQRQHTTSNFGSMKTKSSEKDLLATLNQDTYFTFNLRPPPLPDMALSINKAEKCEIFTVKDGVFTIKNMEYDSRIDYQHSECQYGVFKFTLKNVNYDDEGLYFVSYGNNKSDLRHMKISITVNACHGEDIILRWRIPDTEINDIVYVYVKRSNEMDKKLIFKAYGKVADVSEQFKRCLKFTGNTLNGVMEFSLPNCQSDDCGMYFSSCNGKEIKGRQLLIKASSLKKRLFAPPEECVVMIGRDITLSWYRPPIQSYNALITVTKRNFNEEVLVMTIREPNYKAADSFDGRAIFKGNVRQGNIGIYMKDCRSSDEGIYSAKAHRHECQGPKLEISTLVYVKPGNTADFYWNMNTNVKEVKVCKVNGPSLFVASGVVVAITDQYKDRISYHGNTVCGKMHFTLSNCTVFDNGFYTASCNGMMHGGKLLHIVDPQSKSKLERNFPGLYYAVINGRSSFLYSDYCFVNEMAYIRQKAGENVLYDKNVIIIRLKEYETALLCWQIRPLPEDIMVKVYRVNEDDPLFVASGKRAIEHSKRAKFTGDTTKGLIEFTLSDCTTEDSGYYHSSHDIKNFQGKQLRVIERIHATDVAVLRNDDALLKWNIEPASESNKVKVYKKDGKTLFTVTGEHFDVCQEYKDRIRYPPRGISDGLIEFTISCCQYKDEGLYIASYDGFDFNGPRLKIKLPPPQDIDVGLGDAARIKFYIRPQSNQTLVSVKNNQQVVFTVYGNKAYYIHPSYKGRLLFVGDATEGVIEFTIETCNFQEEGEYIAVVSDSTNHQQIYPGAKLRLALPPPSDVTVAIDSMATMKWYIKPVQAKPNTSTVTVYMVNGKTLFTVYGSSAYIMSEYQDRVEYTGNVIMGVIEFTLKNCLHGDGGQYAASYDDKVYLGPNLCLREIPVQDIIAPLSGTALFKWFIKPPPEGAWITISNREGETLFMVMSNYTDIRESFRGRLQVKGNISKGVIEFLLTECNFGDEGTYIATYADHCIIGPKLIISLVVGDRDAAPISWNIKPVPQGGAVKVFRKNGLHLFTVKGSHAEIMEEYKQRLIFTGDTRIGKIQFVLQDCSHGDTGLYISVYNDDQHDGRHLKVRFLDDEMEKKKAVLKLKLAITMECLEQQHSKSKEKNLREAYTVAELPLFCHYQEGDITFPSLTTRVISPGVTGIMTVGDHFRILLTYAFGKSEGEVKKSLYDKAVSILKSENIDEILNARNIKQNEFGSSIKMSKAHKVEYHYKTSDDICKLLSNLDSQESQRVFMSQLVEDSTVNNHMFSKAAKLLYDCQRISLLDVVTAIRLREINKSKHISSSSPSIGELLTRDDVHCNVSELSSSSPSIGELLTRDDVHCNVSELSSSSPSIGELLTRDDVHCNVSELSSIIHSKSVSDLVLMDNTDDKQRLLEAFNCLSECTKSCGLVLLWSIKHVYGSITPELPRLVYRCIIWIQGKQVAEAFSVGRKFSLQLAAAEALAYLYHSQPVIQRIESNTKCMYSYEADKILNEADSLNKTLTYNERVLLICEGLILHYKKTGEATLDVLEFYPGLPEYVYDNMKAHCTKNNLIYQKKSSRDTDGPVVTISHKLDLYEIVTLLGKYNNQYGTYRLIPAGECVNIAREILMITKDELELFSEDYKL